LFRIFVKNYVMKKVTITLYLTEDEKSKIISMAKSMGQGVDEFILNIVLTKSKEILANKPS